MGDGYADAAGARDTGGDARYDFAPRYRPWQAPRLFAAAAEHERISALDARDDVAVHSEAHHRPFDEGLRRRFAAAAFADLDHARRRARIRARCDRPDRRASRRRRSASAFTALSVSSSGSPGPGADQVHFAGPLFASRFTFCLYCFLLAAASFIVVASTV